MLVAILAFVFILGGFIAYFTLTLTIFIPLGIILAIDCCLIKTTFKSFRKGGKTLFWSILLIVAGVSTFFLGKLSIEKFSEAWLGKNSLNCEIDDINDDTKYYKISMRLEDPYKPEHNTIRIKEYVWDIPSQKSILVSDEEYNYKNENIGQISIEKAWKPCFFEYRLTNEKGKFNGMLLRIGLRDENEIPVKEKRIISPSDIPGGTVDQITGSKKAYIMIY